MILHTTGPVQRIYIPAKYHTIQDKVKKKIFVHPSQTWQMDSIEPFYSLMLTDCVSTRLSYQCNCLYDCLIILIISTQHKCLSLINCFSIEIYSVPAKWLFLIAIIAGGAVAASVRWVPGIVIIQIHVMTRQSLIVKHNSVQTRLFSEMVQV